jgi:hypothetical protein
MEAIPELNPSVASELTGFGSTTDEPRASIPSAPAPASSWFTPMSSSLVATASISASRRFSSEPLSVSSSSARVAFMAAKSCRYCRNACRSLVES